MLSGHQVDFSKLINDVSSPNEMVALNASFQLLGIDAKSYAAIHSTALKKDFLLYKYLYAEYKFCKIQYLPVFDQLQQAIDRAYECVLRSSVTTITNNGYSGFSFGLSELDTRTVQKPNKNDGSLEQSIIKVGDKKGGVEPGFVAIHAKDVLLHIHKRYKSKAERIKIIQDHHSNMKSLYERFKSELPKYLIKLDYQDLKNGKVVVRNEDLKRAKTVQDVYALGELLGDVYVEIYKGVKSVSAIDKNVEAVLEAAANDVARFFVTVSDLTLDPDRYQLNGVSTLKLRLKGAWLPGVSELSPIAGGKNNDNYCVKPTLVSAEGVEYLSDPAAEYFADKLPLLIVQNDRDAIGSKGQNKLRRGNELVAIDFGHAYELATLLVDKVTMDFRIMHPDFKNYSVFYDAKRSNVIRGLIKLAVMSDVKFSEEVLKSYGADFYADVKKIVPHSDEKIFDDYIMKFDEMAHQFRASADPVHVKNENILCCSKIIFKLREAKKKHMTARDQLIDKFRFYLSMQASAIDLLESLEKLATPVSKISLRSPDGSVLLNHLRIDDVNRATWQVKIGYQDQHTYIGTFASEECAAYAMRAIHSMLPQGRQLVSLVQVGKVVEFTFDKAYLSTLANIYSEDKIKQKLAPADYQLFRRFETEQALADLLASFKAYDVVAKVEALEGRAYQLLFKATSLNGMAPAALFKLKSQLELAEIAYQQDVTGLISITVPVDSLRNLYEKVEAFAHDLSQFAIAHQVFAGLVEALATSPHLSNKLILILHDVGNGYELEVLNSNPGEKDADRCVQHFTRYLSKSFKLNERNKHFMISYGEVNLLNECLTSAIETWNNLMQLLSNARASVRANSVFPAVVQSSVENAEVQLSKKM